MKDFLIRILGGITKAECAALTEKIKSDCEKFSILNLTSKDGVCLSENYEVISNQFVHGNMIVIASNTSVMGCNVKKLLVAPWIRGFFAESVITDAAE